MDDAIRVGLTGAGGLGTYLAEQVANAEAGTLSAVADVSERNRRTVGEEHDVDALYADHETMLDGADLNAVLVVTPHALHYEQVLAAFERDLHVLCEKPMVTGVEQARDLAERDDDREEVFMVGYQRHVQPLFRAGRERWGDGLEVGTVAAEITQDWIDDQRGAWRTDPELSGGGFLVDTGSHLVDAVLWMTGATPTAVSATMTTDEPGIDVAATVDVECEGGALLGITTVGDAAGHREHVHAWDDEGGFYIEGRNWRDYRAVEIPPKSGEREVEIPEQAENKVEAFLRCAREGDEPPATARDGLRATAVTAAAYESAETGDRIPVDLD